MQKKYYSVIDGVQDFPNFLKGENKICFHPYHERLQTKNELRTVEKRNGK